jgi:sec-independent protein translocase protein TatA
VLLIFDVSGGELLLIMLVVLLFFGSEGIPGIARTMGRFMRQVRDASAEVQREIQKGTNEVDKAYQHQKRTFITEDAPAPVRTPPPPSPEAMEAPLMEKPAPEAPTEPPGPPGSIPLQH